MEGFNTDRAGDVEILRPSSSRPFANQPNCHPGCLEGPVRYLSPSDALTRFAISNERRSNAICRKSRAGT
jgi:hypothetical protein